MPPYCEEHQMHHDDWYQCQRMRNRARREAKAAALREKAERIAREHAAPFEHETDPRGGDLHAPILAAMTAAAYAALTEKENAR